MRCQDFENVVSCKINATTELSDFAFFSESYQSSDALTYWKACSRPEMATEYCVLYINLKAAHSDQASLAFFFVQGRGV